MKVYTDFKIHIKGGISVIFATLSYWRKILLNSSSLILVSMRWDNPICHLAEPTPSIPFRFKNLSSIN